jgi:hypothetical protein
MAGPGVGDIQPISAGTSAQPLVPTINPVLTGDAVDRLVNAFRNGALNTQDVIDRIGETAQAQKKAKLQALQEYVSPGAIQSRMAAYQAAGAQSNLATQQAQAYSGLVQPQTQLTQAQLAVAQAQATRGAGYQAFLERAPWYGENINQYKKPDGTLDVNAAADRGNEMLSEEATWSPWLNLITPSGSREVTDRNGTKRVVPVNARGQDVSPPDPNTGFPGSPFYQAYLQQLDAYLPKYHKARGLFMKPAKIKIPEEGSVESAPASTSHGVEDTSALPHDMAPAPMIVPEDVAQNDVLNYSLDYFRKQDALRKAAAVKPADVAIPAATDTAPVINPVSATPATEGGLVTSPGMTLPEARDKLHTIPNVNDWSKSQSTYQRFATAAASPQNSVTDLNLAETFSKILDPQSTLREFKFEALKDAIPWLSYISKEGIDTIKREKRFPADVRQRIIDEGFANVDAADNAVRDTFKQAEQMTPGVLDDRQKAVINGVPFKKQVGFKGGSSPASAAATSTTPPPNMPGAFRTTVGGKSGWATPAGLWLPD